MKGERGEAEEPVIDLHHPAAQPHAGDAAEHRADHHDDERKFQIMPADLAARNSRAP